jgi:hypothetical protein
MPLARAYRRPVGARLGEAAGQLVGPGGGAGPPRAPGGPPDEGHGGAGEPVPEVRLRQPAVARRAHSDGVHALGEGPRHAGARGMRRLQFGGRFAAAGGAQGRVLRRRARGEAARPPGGARAARAAGPARQAAGAQWAVMPTLPGGAVVAGHVPRAWPRGRAARRAARSRAKPARANAPAGRACQGVSPGGGPTRAPPWPGRPATGLSAPG